MTTLASATDYLDSIQNHPSTPRDLLIRARSAVADLERVELRAMNHPRGTVEHERLDVQHRIVAGRVARQLRALAGENGVSPDA